MSEIVPLIFFHIEGDIDFSLSKVSDSTDWLNEVSIREGYVIGHLNYIFGSDDYILKINQEYLQHDYFTDVISFQYEASGPIEGDIFISIDRVKENAQQLGLPWEEELHRVMVHGLLHMMTYQDKTEEEQAIMRQKEDLYLNSYKKSKTL